MYSRGRNVITTKDVDVERKLGHRTSGDCARYVRHFLEFLTFGDIDF